MVKNNTLLEEKFSFVGEKAKSTSGRNFSKIVTIDLSSQDAIASIKFAVERSRVIASEARNTTMAVAALIAGADAVTYVEITPSEIELVRSAINRDCIIADTHFLVFPKTKILAKLERAQNQIALEILNYWRSQPFDSPPTIEQLSLSDNLEELEEKLPNKIKQKNGASIDCELEAIIENVKYKKIDLTDLLDHTEIFLEKWHFDNTDNCCLAIFKANAHSITEAILTDSIKTCQLWNNSGSYTLSKWLSATVSRLKALEIKYERNYQLFQDKFYSASNSYRILRNISEQEEKKSRKTFESAINALKLRYKELITARTQLMAGQIISQTIYSLEKYSNKIIATDTLLYQLSVDLHNKEEECSNDSIFVGLSVSQIEQFGILPYRDRLTMRLGKPFHQWGSLRTDKQEILKQEISKKAYTIAWEVIIAQY